MAQHFPLENNGGEDNDSFEDWTLPTESSSGMSREMKGRTQELQPPGSLPIRSNPIAIKRNPKDKKQRGYHDSSDDEMDDSSTIDVELDALKIASSTTNHRSEAISLPSHLLRAPRLQSVPTRDDSWMNQRYPSMLPPAMNAADQPLGSGTPSGVGFSLARGDERVTSYGSLRDSHTRGKFLDGPSSYRDRETGNIRRIQHTVRFRENGSVASSLPSLSIGERIMKSRQERANGSNNEAKKKEPTSSLAALMEASDKQDPEPEPDVDVPNLKTATFYDQEIESRLPQNMLSTSLTGLEILQAGLRVAEASGTSTPPSSVASPAYALTANSEELPRDANGHNVLLGRSLSDPMPRHLQNRPVIPGLASPSLLLPPRHGSVGDFQQQQQQQQQQPPQQQQVPTFRLDASPPRPPVQQPQSAVYHAQMPGQQAAEGITAPGNDHNPDTDCAFEFEME